MAHTTSLHQAVSLLPELKPLLSYPAESFEAFCQRHDEPWFHLKSTVCSVNMKGDRNFSCGAAKLFTSCSGTQWCDCRNPCLPCSQVLLLCLWILWLKLVWSKMNNSSILIEEVGRSVELVLQYKANISTDAQYVPMPIVYRHISINKLYQCAT